MTTTVHRDHQARAADWYGWQPSATNPCCGRCNGLPECATYADAAGERHGVWAGVCRDSAYHRKEHAA